MNNRLQTFAGITLGKENLLPRRSRSPQRFLRGFLRDLCALVTLWAVVKSFGKPTKLATPLHWTSYPHFVTSDIIYSIVEVDS